MTAADDAARAVPSWSQKIARAEDEDRFGVFASQGIGCAAEWKFPIGQFTQTQGLTDAMVEHVLGALESAGWVQKAAAAKLDMSPSRLNQFLNRHGLIDEVKRRRSNQRSGHSESASRSLIH